MRFPFPRELDRIAYLFRALIFNLPLIIISSNPAGPAGLLIILALLVGFIFLAAIPRIRNIGWPLWTVVLVLIPYLGVVYSIFLAFTKSKKDREAEYAALKSSP